MRIISLIFCFVMLLGCQSADLNKEVIYSYFGEKPDYNLPVIEYTRSVSTKISALSEKETCSMIIGPCEVKKAKAKVIYFLLKRHRYISNVEIHDSFEHVSYKDDQIKAHGNITTRENNVK